MEKKKLAVSLCGICLLLTFSTLPFITSLGFAAERAIELKVSHFWPPTSANHEHMVRWKQKIEADSKGRLTLRIFPSGTLLGQQQEWEGLSKGVADVVMGIRLETAGREFSFRFTIFTMGVTDTRIGGQLMYDLYNEFPEYRAEWKDIKILYLGAAGPTQIHSKKPVHKLEDLKGMQIRTAPGAGIDAVKLLGATPVTMPMSEVFMAIQKGTVEGLVGPYDVLKGFRLTDVTRYTTNAHLWILLGHYVGMNLNTYNKLPADLQKVINDSIEWAKEDYWKMWDSIDKDSIEYAKEKKHEFIDLAQSERERWQTAVKPLQDKIAAELDAKGYPGTRVKEFLSQRIKYHVK